MSEARTISSILKSVSHGPAWHGPSVMETLDGVSAKQAVSEANGKLLNYMAVGIPVVATDTPVNRELLGELGVYAPVDDASALADAIVKILEDGELAADLGHRLRRRAVEQMSWSAGGDQIVDTYRELLEPGGANSSGPV